MVTSHPTPARRRWGLRFGLRTLVVGTLLVAIGSSVYRRYAAYQALDIIQAKAEFVRPLPKTKGWRRLFDDSVYRIHHLSFHSKFNVSDEDMVHVAKLRYLKRLSLHRTAVTNQGAQLLKPLSRLEAISFQGTQVDDEGVAVLRSMPNLKSVSLNNTVITDAGLAHLADLKNLETLYLQNTAVTAEGIQQLHQCRRLRQLKMRLPGWTPHRPVATTLISQLKHFQQLEELDLVDLECQQRDVKDLMRLTKLRVLNLSCVGIETFPPEFFASLPALEKFNVSSPQLRSVEIEGHETMETISLGFGRETLEVAATNLPQLNHLRIRGGALSNVTLSNTPSLAALNCSLFGQLKMRGPNRLRGLQLHVDEPMELQDLRELESLELRGRGINRQGLKQLSECPGLQSLTLVGHTSLVRELPRLANLQQLVIHDNSAEFSDYSPLSQQPSLTSLVIYGPDVTNAELLTIGSLNHLESLHVYGEQITDDGLRLVGDMKNLQQLWLNHASIHAPGLRHLQQCESLTSLSLDDTSISDADCQALGQLTQLVDLSLRNTSITNDGLQYLRDLKQLRSLALDNTRITGIGVRHLSEMRQLKNLSLARLRLTDRQLEYIEVLDQLESLNVNGCRFTDAAIDTFLSLPKLRSLSYSGIGFSGQGVQRLHAKFARP